jgi:WhiB family redox-sensing transcriptional regulator
MTDIRHLPGPGLDFWDWQAEGACRGLDTEMFFHPDNERGPRRAGREAAAKAVCATCPVMRECAEHALRVREPYGIWGGLSESERDEILAGRRTIAVRQAS